MKNFISLALLLLFAASCNKKTTTETVNAEPATEAVSTSVAVDTVKSPESETGLFACSMHPEVTGKKGAECSKCGMALTVPVK